MFTQKELRKAIKLADIVDNGSFKIFIRVNSKWGLKLCQSRIVRDYNFVIQRKASKFQYGPYAYHRFEVTLKYVTYYGFVTQVADPVNEDDFWDNAEVDVLINDLKRVCGFDISWDKKPCNFGKIGGKIVVIDFDKKVFCGIDHCLDYKEYCVGNLI